MLTSNEINNKFYKGSPTTLYNVSFGILLFFPPGWAIVIGVLLLETYLFHKFLKVNKPDAIMIISVVVANIVSGIAGVFASMATSGGWYLVCWFPWVSSYEIKMDEWSFFVLYFIAALIFSILIEAIINGLILHKKYGLKKAIYTTIDVNLISNILTALLLYAYSFSSWYLPK